MTAALSLLGGLALAVGSYIAAKYWRGYQQTLSSARQKSSLEIAKKTTEEQGQTLQAETDKLSELDQ
jgi:hypothetical protein